MNEAHTPSTFGSRLKALRKDRGKTQLALAFALSTDTSTISRWENDNRQPDYETLKTLATNLGTSTEYLMYGEDNGSEDLIDLSGLTLEQKTPSR